MVMGEIPEKTGILVIGGGPAGYTAAIRAGQLGLDVTLVEREELGGECLNYGCIPSKALIYAANFAGSKKKLAIMGIDAEFRPDIVKIMQWKDGVVKKLVGGVHNLCKKYNVEVIKGTARFQSPNHAEIPGLTKIEFDKAIIATGSRTRDYPGFPFDGSRIISHREAVNLKTVPSDLLIIGAGYISVELGMMYAKLGSRVRIIQRSERILTAVEPEIAEIVAKHMAELRIEIYTESKPVEHIARGEKSVVVVDSKEKGRLELEADKVLVAVGHAPNTEGLNLESTKVEIDRKGFIKVNEKRQTTDPKIYAIGDVAGAPLLAHKAYREGKVVAEVLAGLPSAFDNVTVPAVIFSDPEIAVAGLTEQEAKDKGYKIKTGKFNFRSLGRALAMEEPDGFVKIVADADNGAIIGVHVVGAGASDMISEASLAIEMGALLDDVALTIHPHPTPPEAFAEAADVALGKSVHK